MFWQTKHLGTSCAIDYDCLPTETCSANYCKPIACTGDANCQGKGVCINSFCQAIHCTKGNDCPNNMACVQDGYCVVIGQECTSNNECYGLTCSTIPGTGVTASHCMQCVINTECENGQICSNNVCRYPNVGEHVQGMITFPSPAYNNGNVTAPLAYACDDPEFNMFNPTYTSPPTPCSTTADCMNTNPLSFCVNGVCRCTKGQNLETCTSNFDCLSSTCMTTSIGKVCANDTECIYNYNPTAPVTPGVCPADRPYCTQGTCSTSSFMAICGGGVPGALEDVCYNPAAVGSTSSEHNNMGFFCTNGYCQGNPGQLNEYCVINSCSQGLNCQNKLCIKS